MLSSILKLSLALLATSNVVNAGRPLHCFYHDDDDALDLKVEDITYAGNHLRAEGRHDEKGAFLNLSPGGRRYVVEEGTVSVLVINTDKKNPASVLLEDIANTIDGGETRDEVGPAIIQCASVGGYSGVYYDPANPAYKASGGTPEGIVVKLEAADSDDL